MRPLLNRVEDAQKLWAMAIPNIQAPAADRFVSWLGTFSDSEFEYAIVRASTDALPSLIAGICPSRDFLMTNRRDTPSKVATDSGVRSFSWDGARSPLGAVWCDCFESIHVPSNGCVSATSDFSVGSVRIARSDARVLMHLHRSGLASNSKTTRAHSRIVWPISNRW